MGSRPSAPAAPPPPPPTATQQPTTTQQTETLNDTSTSTDVNKTQDYTSQGRSGTPVGSTSLGEDQNTNKTKLLGT